ncbi:hypothetical protein FQR65_LT18798 [Abscondita terminalis]|nr:hypothetical protein FQR65_LT18798 [Abscondita terminalis]
MFIAPPVVSPRNSASMTSKPHLPSPRPRVMLSHPGISPSRWSVTAVPVPAVAVDWPTRDGEAVQRPAAHHRSAAASVGGLIGLGSVGSVVRIAATSRRSITAAGRPWGRALKTAQDHCGPEAGQPGWWANGVVSGRAVGAECVDVQAGQRWAPQLLSSPRFSSPCPSERGHTALVMVQCRPSRWSDRRHWARHGWRDVGSGRAAGAPRGDLTV